MTVELNSIFVSEQLRSGVEHYLRQAWARANFSPDTFRVRWVQQDPGDLVIGIEMGRARLLREVGEIDSERRAAGRILLEELSQMLTAFLRANHH